MHLPDVCAMLKLARYCRTLALQQDPDCPGMRSCRRDLDIKLQQCYVDACMLHCIDSDLCKPQHCIVDLAVCRSCCVSAPVQQP